MKHGDMLPIKHPTSLCFNQPRDTWVVFLVQAQSSHTHELQIFFFTWTLIFVSFDLLL